MNADQSNDTLGDQLTAYRYSAEFSVLAPSTKREYERVIEHVRAEIGATPLSLVSRPWLRKLRALWAIMGHRAATVRLQLLKNALAPAIEDGLAPAGLFANLQRVDRPHGLGESNPFWTDAEFQTVLDDCLCSKRYGLARALALARWAGFRRGTICGIRNNARYAVDQPDGSVQMRIRHLTEKGQVLGDKAEDRRLTALLNATPTAGCETIAYSGTLKPWLPRGLNHALDRQLARLKDRGLLERKLTLHGLRHSRGVELAEAGASDAVLMAQLEHTDEQSAKLYRRQAGRKGMADLGQALVDRRTDALAAALVAHRQQSSDH